MIRQMMAMQGGMGGGGSPFGGAGGAGAQNPLVAGFGAQAEGNNTPSTGGDGAAPATPGQGAANPFGMNPDMMRMLMGMGGGGAGAGGPGGAGGFGGLGGLAGLGGMGGFGGFGGGGGAQGQTPAADPLPQDTRSLEDRFSNQLRTLNEMGLVDPQQNLRALSMTGGTVEAAIELIFSGREWCRGVFKVRLKADGDELFRFDRGARQFLIRVGVGVVRSFRVVYPSIYEISTLASRPGSLCATIKARPAIRRYCSKPRLAKIQQRLQGEVWFGMQEGTRGSIEHI